MNRPNAYLVMDGAWGSCGKQMSGAVIKPNTHGQCHYCGKKLHGDTAVVMQGYRRKEDGSFDETRKEEIVICLDCF